MDVLADWIEGSVAFAENKLSRADVVDVLCENGIYEKQDFANARVTDAWCELERRYTSVAGGAPFVLKGRRINRCYAWEENLAYSFCLLLSMQRLYKGWTRQFGSNYTEQGDLFEKLTAECLEKLGWSVLRTGWATDNTSKIRDVVEKVGNHLGEVSRTNELDKWVAKDANEEGLDVVCSDPFPDGWGGRPVYFFQCASGGNWQEKLHTPDLKTWQQLISFTTVPQRGFSMPFSLLADEFRRKANKVNGMFLDRFRLQSPSIEGDIQWISRSLATNIARWMRPRVKKLPDGRA